MIGNLHGQNGKIISPSLERLLITARECLRLLTNEGRMTPPVAVQKPIPMAASEICQQCKGNLTSNRATATLRHLLEHSDLAGPLNGVYIDYRRSLIRDA